MTSLALAFDLLANDKNASKTFDKVGDSAGRAGKIGKAAGVAIAAGMVAAGVAAVKFGKSSISAFENSATGVKRLQRVAGGTVEDVSRLSFAVKESGVSADTFEGAIRKLSAGLTKADKAGKAVTVGYKYQIEQMPRLVKGHIEYHDVLKRVAIKQAPAAKSALDLGFAYRDAHGQLLPMNELLPKLADKFEKLPAGAEKTALAVKLFGRSGTELLPFLNKGADGIAELEKQSDKLGHTLHTSDLTAIKENAEAHKKFHAAVEGLQIQVGRLLLPVMARFATFSTSVLVPVIVKVTDLVRTRLAPAFHDFLDGLRGAEGGTFFSHLGEDVGKFEKRVVDVFTIAKKKVAEFFQGFNGPTEEKLPGPGRKGETLDASPVTAASTLGEKARSLFETLRKTIVSDVIPAVSELGRNIIGLAVTMSENLFPVLRDVVGKLFDARAIILPLAAAFLAINAAVTVTTGVMDVVTGVTEAYGTAMKTLTAVKAFFIATTDAETGAVTASTLSMIGARIASAAETVALYGLIVAEKIAAAGAKAFAAAQWLVNAALDANPIALVVVGLAALAAGLVYAYKTSDTFRSIVKEAFGVVLHAVSAVLDALGSLLGALGHVPGFGWAKDAANALHGAAKAADGLADSINAVPKHVDIGVNFKAYGANALGVATNAAVHGRATGGPVSAGTPYIVGEIEPELFVPNQSGRILNQRQIRQAAGRADDHTGEQTRLLREQNALLREQNQLIATSGARTAAALNGTVALANRQGSARVAR